MNEKFQLKEVEKVFEDFPLDIREKLLTIRSLIFSTAKKTKGVGFIEESLKWGEPAYLTSETKSGTTIRLGYKKKNPNSFSIFVNCNTSLIDTFDELFGDKFEFIGNREIVFHKNDQLPTKELEECIRIAFTYHLSKKQK